MTDFPAVVSFVGDAVQTIAAPVVIYLIWDMKRNHLPHIYARLDALANDVAYLRGIDEGEARKKQLHP
jgi:hypothetical protein